MAGLSETDVANVALRALGELRIAALSEAIERARVLNDLFTTVVESVLSAHDWNDAIKRIALPEAADPPVFGYSKRYALPANFLRMVTDEGDTGPLNSVTGVGGTETGWKREGQFILSNESSLKIRYVARIPVGEMAVSLAKAIAYRLAADSALRLTGDKNKKAAMERDYEKQLAEARAIDGQEGSPEELDTDVWLRARQ